ncbi:flagellar hook protein FlgE [Algicola sagamiensis]|uniref:flagellar hook protein FlgE n=1 Tax=Algicola sagamiensis TaxID=163869 RepID=UPI0003786446|nr:flagellar hook protein FlgE [Algicola sagamiensis]
MSFNIALTGLAAAQKDLDTTANNIANVNTTGFKESRAEFADVYAASVFSAGKTKVGDGAITSAVAQQFTQGSLKFTSNSLDLAITGDGFFATTPTISSKEHSFTRAGAFKLNKNNFIVDNNGNFLQGFQVDATTGDVSSISLDTTIPIQIPDSAGAPRATQNAFITMNLKSDENVPGVVPVNPSDSATYNFKTSVNVFDSLGGSHLVDVVFVKDATARRWNVYAALDGQAISGTAGDFSTPTVQLNFNADGTMNTAASPNLVLPQANLNALIAATGAQFTSDVTINWRDQAGTKLPTQYESKFELTNAEQDGTTVGRLTGVDVNTEGKIVASYSNGDTTFLGQVAMARFANPQGLTQVGNTSWKESLSSGEALAGEANSGTFGAVNSSSLEQSNVNLTNELVNLISAQRNFQANSRALEVNSTIQQTILQIR